MIAQFNNINSGSFSLNGISYYKVFIPVAIGNVAVKVVSIYDSRFELLPPTNLADIRVNGTAYGSVASLVNVLKGVVFDYPDITAAMQAEIDDIRTDVEIFKEDILVNGNPNKYYQVAIRSSQPQKIRTLKIYRTSGEQAPYEWNNSNTNKGALAFEVRCNHGTWGGHQLDWKILDLRQQYTTMVANAGITSHGYDFYVMLRGGGGLYHLESDQRLNDIRILYSSSELVYSHSNSAYNVYGLDPLTTPNTANLNSHTYKVGI